MLFQLFNLAEKHGIVIEYWDFTHPIKALSIREEGLPPIIGLSKSLLENSAEHNSYLAEELGHHIVGRNCGNATKLKSYRDKLLTSWEENKALKWAANFLISDEEFIRAQKEGLNIFEMCELFNATEKIIKTKQEIIKQRALLEIYKDRFSAKKEIAASVCR